MTCTTSLEPWRRASRPTRCAQRAAGGAPSFLRARRSPALAPTRRTGWVTTSARGRCGPALGTARRCSGRAMGVCAQSMADSIAGMLAAGLAGISLVGADIWCGRRAEAAMPTAQPYSPRPCVQRLWRKHDRRAVHALDAAGRAVPLRPQPQQLGRSGAGAIPHGRRGCQPCRVAHALRAVALHVYSGSGHRLHATGLAHTSPHVRSSTSPTASAAPSRARSSTRCALPAPTHTTRGTHRRKTGVRCRMHPTAPRSTSTDSSCSAPPSLYGPSARLCAPPRL
jgi:hypothetical protein